MKIQAINSNTRILFRAENDRVDRRYSGDLNKQQKVNASLHDLYAESDKIQKMIRKQNELIAYALASQSKYIVKQTPDSLERAETDLINLASNGNVDRFFK